MDSKKVTALDDWKCQFTDLDVNKNGTKIAYTITEDFIPFYMTEISGSADQGYTVKNTHRPWFPNIPGTPGDTTELTVKKTVSGAAEEDKAFDIYVRFTSGDDTYVELLNLKATDEAYSFDLVEYGTKIEIIENAPGYDMTCRVNGEEMTSFEVSKDGGDKIEVIVNNHKDVPKEPEKPQDKPEPTPEKKTAVKTGDETNILGYSLLMAIGVLGALVVTRKKHQ